MEFQRVVRQRRMVRNYDPDRQPSESVIAQLIGLAGSAPSAGYSQGWHFVVLATPDDRNKFWNASSDPSATPDGWLSGMKSAPVLILALSDPEAYLDRYAEDDKGWRDRSTTHWPVPYWDVDTGMASLLILLGVVDHGLAGCFFGVPVERLTAVRQALEIPARLNIVGVISLGYPRPDRRSPSLKRGRRPVAEIASRGTFGIPYAEPTSKQGLAVSRETGATGAP
jgi:nitroreductase